MPHVIVGVDIAKDWIDAHTLPCGTDRRIPVTALRAFAKTLKGAFVVFEASGGYDRPFLEILEKAGIPYARVNPRQAREFARATGRLAKTDRIDASVLAHMGRALDLPPTSQISPARRRLASLVARRQDIAQTITRETNRLAQAADAFVRREIKSLLIILKRRLALMEKEISTHIQNNEDLAALQRRLRTVPGIGPAIAPILIARLPELGQLNRRKIACLAGLAPQACDSGKHSGRRRIWGGRADIRRALYLAAFVASRYNPELVAYRKRLQDNGTPVKAAIVATARKLLVHLNAIVKEERDYHLKPAT